MSLEQRILVVEDYAPTRDYFVGGLAGAGFSVDSAENLQTALDLIAAKTFHLVLTELLFDAPYGLSSDGLKVLKVVQDLDEGTKAIVISGQQSVGLAVDAITEYGAVEYVEKLAIRDRGMEYLVEKVSHWAKSAKIKKYGNYDSIFSVMAGDDKERVVLADSLLRILRPTDGFVGLNSFLTRFCDSMFPLMPQYNTLPPLSLHVEDRYARGKFWSKGMGVPVELVFCRLEEAGVLISKPTSSVWPSSPLVEYENNGLKGYAFELPADIVRSDFVERFAPNQP